MLEHASTRSDSRPAGGERPSRSSTPALITPLPPSAGPSGPGTKSPAAEAAVAAGVIMCVAAGNSGGFAIISSPGTSRLAITVGAINDTGSLASFSSRGPTPGDLLFKPDVVAPGVDIPSSFPGGGFK